MKRVLFVVVLVALFAASCATQTPVVAPQAAEADVTVAEVSTSEPESPTPVATAPLAAETVESVEVTPDFSGSKPPGSVTPASWSEPLPLDPAVVQGQLPNGMTYLIRKNERPGTQAQLRLVVQAGSVNESASDLGVAHFLEHMMFNGTELFPGNDIVQILEGFGSGFGPDVNAYTSFEETVYELQVPTRSDAVVQLALDVLHQWATAATLDDDDVAAERGVVREELRRSVEPLSGRLGRENRQVLLAGTPYLGQDPIGSATVIDTMTSEQLRAFYEQWYRPELMTIVAVGDFDVGDMERRIQETFVQPASPEPVQPFDVSQGSGELPESTFAVFTDAEIQRSEVSAYWRLDGTPTQTQAGLRAGFVRSLTMSMLNTRLFEQVQSGETELLSSGAGVGNFTSTTQIVSLTARSDETQVEAGLGELLTQLERARQFGFAPAELERAVAEVEAQIDQDFAKSDTRQDRDYADELIGLALERQVPTEAKVSLELGREILASITVEDTQGFLFELAEANPYVVVTGPESEATTLPTPAVLQATYESIVGKVVDQQERVDGEVTELMERPPPAEILDRQRLDALDATVVTYANGARLAYRQTAITENIVKLRAHSHGGAFAVEGQVVPLIDRVPTLVSGSGFETINVVTLDRLLAGSIASLGPSISRASENLSGESSTDDVEVLFQLAHLQMTQPMISELQTRLFDEGWRPLAANPALNPSTVGNLELWDLRYGDSPWFRLIPSVEDLDGLDTESLLRAYKQRFANAGDFVFVVVGDFDEAELVDLGARYLGTLPDAGERESPIDRDPGIPESNLQSTVQAGVGDQGSVRINWESPYPFTMEADVTAQALEIVVNARLRDLIREQLGASYAPRADVSVLSEPKPWVDTIIEVESDPDRVEEVSRAIHQELERIRAGDVDPQYLDLAIDQLVEDYRFFSNNDWLDLLTFHVLYPDRSAGEFRDRTGIVERLTVADLAAAAEVVFPASRSVEIWLVPADS